MRIRMEERAEKRKQEFERKKQRTKTKKSKTWAIIKGQKGTTSILAKQSDLNGEIRADVYAQEVLLHLPASKLQTLKIVNKDWLRLITSSCFIRLHLSSSRSRIRILVTFPCAILEYNNYNQLGTEQIPYPPKFSGSNTTILGSADGLICLVDERAAQTRVFTLFNPSTRKNSGGQLWTFSSHSYNILCFWFGKHVDGDYILVMGTCSPNLCYDIGVYKFTSSNIKCIYSISMGMQVPHPSCFKSPEIGTLVNGAVHWAIFRTVTRTSHFTILVYHPHENKYWEISPPTKTEFRLGVVDGCSLCAISKNIINGVFEVWVMKECWTKYANIQGFNNSLRLSPLGFFPNGDVILDVDKKQLIKYNFNNNQIKNLVQYDCVRHGAIMCADSLVSPALSK